MKILVSEISESPKASNILERFEDLNKVFNRDKVREFQFLSEVEGSLVYYRSGRELFFQGCFETRVEGVCSRCIKDYSFPLGKNFDFILSPNLHPTKKDGRLKQDEMGLSYYSGGEINLSPFIQEQVLLALPIRSLCDEGCRGLCPDCGVNLNMEYCGCSPASSDPRMAFFRNLRV